jgi:hypothetical protein
MINECEAAGAVYLQEKCLLFGVLQTQEIKLDGHMEFCASVTNVY